jgi:hypothetical protein
MNLERGLGVVVSVRWLEYLNSGTGAVGVLSSAADFYSFMSPALIEVGVQGSRFRFSGFMCMSGYKQHRNSEPLEPEPQPRWAGIGFRFWALIQVMSPQ